MSLEARRATGYFLLTLEIGRSESPLNRDKKKKKETGECPRSLEKIEDSNTRVDLNENLRANAAREK